MVFSNGSTLLTFYDFKDMINIFYLNIWAQYIKYYYFWYNNQNQRYMYQFFEIKLPVTNNFYNFYYNHIIMKMTWGC